MKTRSRSSVRGLIAVVSVALLGLVLSVLGPGPVAHADSVTYSSLLISEGPSFDSPDVISGACTPPSSLYSPPDTFFYQAQTFTVSSAGTYTLSNLSNTFTDQDSFLLLYTPSFNPSSPLTNLFGANDEGPVDHRSQLSCSLASGTPYVLVTTTYFVRDTGSFTNQISGPGTVTLLGPPTGTPTVAPTPPATSTAPAGMATLNGIVTLQGLTPGTGSYQVTLDVRLFEPSTGNLIQSFGATTDQNGNFMVNNMTPGTYDIEVKEPRRIGRIARGVTLAGVMTIGFGNLLAGDVNGDDAVSLVDYSRLRASYGKCDGDIGYQSGADFTGDGCVGLSDYSRLRANFGIVGPLAAR